MKVPLLEFKEQHAALAPQLHEAFTRVLDSGQFILGREVEEFERAAGVVVDTKHALGVSSGTDAILLALMALDIGPGDEVICPTFTFFATAGCIARVGATPIFADSCPICFNIDVEDAARRVTSKTKAFMPVHLFGQAAEMNGIMKLAAEHGVRVIEDAAQAFGASHRNRKLGSIGDFGTFSFFPSKNLGGFGDSGLLVANDDELAAKARIMRTHGAKPKYFHKVVGGNFRMDPLLAALLAVKLPHLSQYTESRQKNAAYYTSKLRQIAGVSVAQTMTSSGNCSCGSACRETPSSHILLPAAIPHNEHIWNQYTLRIQSGAPWKNSGNPRDALQKFLAAREIGSEIYYPKPMHLQECFAGVAAAQPRSFPIAERLSSECLSIPVFPELKREQADAVVDAIGDFMKETAVL